MYLRGEGGGGHPRGGAAGPWSGEAGGQGSLRGNGLTALPVGLGRWGKRGVGVWGERGGGEGEGRGEGRGKGEGEVWISGWVGGVGVRRGGTFEPGGGGSNSG